MIFVAHIIKIMNDKVDEYINKAPLEKRKILQKLRETILQAEPEIRESFKNGVPWYEDRFYIVVLKDHVNMGFALGNMEIADKLEGKGKYMRHLKFRSIEDIDEKFITSLIKQTQPKLEG